MFWWRKAWICDAFEAALRLASRLGLRICSILEKRSRWGGHTGIWRDAPHKVLKPKRPKDWLPRQGPLSEESVPQRSSNFRALASFFDQAHHVGSI